MSQCWPRSMSPYGATRPQWVKVSEHRCHGYASWKGLLRLCQYTSITHSYILLITWYRGGAFNPSDASLSYAHVEITKWCICTHYSDVTMRLMTSPINIVWNICSTICSGAHPRKHQKSTSLAFMRGIPPVTGGFPSQRANNAENVSIWWRHHGQTHMWTKEIYTTPSPCRLPHGGLLNVWIRSYVDRSMSIIKYTEYVNPYDFLQLTLNLNLLTVCAARK